MDLSRVAIDKVRRRAEEAGADCTLAEGDLTAAVIPDLVGPFDFMLDFGTLDDLKGVARSQMVATIDRLSRLGTSSSSGASTLAAISCPVSASKGHLASLRRSSRAR